MNARRGIGIAILLSVLAWPLLRSFVPGPVLGSYRFENARLVDWATLTALDGSYESLGQTHLIRIEFSSDLDLEAASGGSGSNSGLFMKSDFCPFSNGNRLAAFGPFFYNVPAVAGQRGEERPLYDRADRNDQSHPARDPRTRRYLYTAYLMPSEPMGGPRIGYDLHEGNRDICLRIDHPGLFASQTQSDVIVIPRAAIAPVVPPPAPEPY